MSSFLLVLKSSFRICFLTLSMESPQEAFKFEAKKFAFFDIKSVCRMNIFLKKIVHQTTFIRISESHLFFKRIEIIVIKKQ